jgi:hypothetical protein
LHGPRKLFTRRGSPFIRRRMLVQTAQRSGPFGPAGRKRIRRTPTMNRTRNTVAAAASALCLLAGTPFANAQGGFLHRHSTGAGIVAGLAAHHMAKRGAASRAASGRRPNFAERHPMATGIAAGMATHHMLKRH